MIGGYFQRISADEADINSFHYQLLCNYMGKDKLEREVWFNPNRYEFAVLIDGKTCVELSFRDDNCIDIFDYIEATIDRSKQMICYESETFPDLMDKAMENGSKYPAIQSTLGKEKGRIARFVQSLLPQKPLTPYLEERLLNAYEVHVVDPDYRVEEEEYGGWLTPLRVPVENLPDGWVWEHFDDGSGSLKSPEGQRYYEYDIQNGIEYKATPSSQWRICWDSFEEFQNYAEACIKRDLEQKEELAQEREQAQEQVQTLEESIEQEM